MFLFVIGGGELLGWEYLVGPMRCRFVSCLRESGTLISRHGGQTHAYRNNTGRGVFLRCVFRIRGTSGGGNILAY